MLHLSVSGPRELVTQVFAVLLEYLTSPDSSPTVQAQGVAGRAGRGRSVGRRGKRVGRTSAGRSGQGLLWGQSRSLK